MKKWHVNEKGNAGKCDATVKPCPLGGGPDEHYATKAEALYAYETKQNAQGKTFSATLTKKKNKNKSAKQKVYKFAAFGGVALSAFSLAACDSDITINDDGDVEVGGYTIDTENGDIEGGSSDGGSSSSASDVDPNQILWMGEEMAPSQDEVNEAQANLDSLVVASEVERPDYDREEMFGGFNSGTVERIENRDLPLAEFESGSDSRAVGGYMYDPYTGEQIQIIEGERSDIDTEHIIALKEVTESERVIINTDSEAEAIKQDPYLLNDYAAMGESNLTEEEIDSIIANPESLDDYYLDADEKDDIANADVNLTIVSSSANREKSDGDVNDWMPSYEPVHCDYVVSAIKVKAEYNLSVDSAEAEVMQDTLDNKCS